MTAAAGPASLIELVERAQQGDSAALNHAVRRIYPRVLSYLQGRFPSNALADQYEDVANEVMIRVVLHLDSCRARTNRRFLSWVMAIARREALRLVSSPRQRNEYPVVPGALESMVPGKGTAIAGPGGSTLQPLLELLELLLDDLDEDKQRLLYLRFVQQLEWDAVGEELGTTGGAAKRRFQRLQKVLARRIVAAVHDQRGPRREEGLAALSRLLEP